MWHQPDVLRLALRFCWHRLQRLFPPTGCQIPFLYYNRLTFPKPKPKGIWRDINCRPKIGQEGEENKTQRWDATNGRNSLVEKVPLEMAGSHAEQGKKKKQTVVKAQKTNKKITKMEKLDADLNAVPTVSFFATPLQSKRNRWKCKKEEWGWKAVF